MVKNLPAMQETWVRLPGQKMATHSSILALGNPMDRGARQATVKGCKRVRHNLATKQQQQKQCLSYNNPAHT